MKATVKTDHRERVIEIEVTGAPPIDVSETWHKVPREIDPHHVRMVIIDDQPHSIFTRGMVRKKDGTPGLNKGHRTWVADHEAWSRAGAVGSAPEWVREIWAQAPLGIREFTWTQDEVTA